MPIAIIGVSAELPSGAEGHNLDYDAFWPFLLGKGEAYSQIPSDRFNSDAYVLPSAIRIESGHLSDICLGFQI